jgi:putative ABC transport system permease protein
MFKNYFIVAFRNLLKRKGFSLINILGLATGMAVCLLIVLFIQSELGFDKQHEKADNIYRVVLERSYPGRSTSYAIIPQSIGAAIKNEYPECLKAQGFSILQATEISFCVLEKKLLKRKGCLLLILIFSGCSLVKYFMVILQQHWKKRIQL